MTDPGIRRRLRLAIVGCGAAARKCHLPGLLGINDFELVAFVDPLEDHARRLAAEYVQKVGSGSLADVRIATEVNAVLGEIDAAVIASPHNTHAELVITLARARVHCLVEKLMAVSVAECTAMSDAARQHGVVLAVGHMRRLFPASQWIKALITAGELGDLLGVTWQEGEPYDWPLTSTSLFDPRVSGGGVLADTGPHVLDLLLWLLAADHAEVLAYRDSSLGGAESEAAIELRIAGADVHVVMSRLRSLENTCVMRGSVASVEFGTARRSSFIRRNASGVIVDQGVVPTAAPPQESSAPLFSEQLRKFAAAIRGEGSPYAGAEDGRRVVDLIERCYAKRGYLSRPWRDIGELSRC